MCNISSIISLVLVCMIFMFYMDGIHYLKFYDYSVFIYYVDLV